MIGLIQAFKFEFAALLAVFVSMVAGIFSVDSNSELRRSLFGCIVTIFLLLVVHIFSGYRHFRSVYVFDNAFVLDGLAYFGKILSLVVLGILTFLLCGDRRINLFDEISNDKMIVFFMSLLGCYIMMSANDFMLLYVGMEMAALSLYILLALSSSSVSTAEAAVKYFLLGALSSAIFLYGVSLVYGYSGTFHYSALIDNFNNAGWSPMLMLGCVLIMATLCFKLGAAPFHSWVPDVYQGSSWMLLSYMATIPKIAVLIVVIRLLDGPFSLILNELRPVLRLVAAISMLVGTAGLIRQHNFKRFIGFMSVGSAGYILFSLSENVASAVSGGLLFYLVYYLGIVLALIAFALRVVRSGRLDTRVSELSLHDLRGYASRRPMGAMLLSCVLFSAASFPPFAGFFAKYYAMRYALLSFDLAVLAVIVSGIMMAYVCLSIIRDMYFVSDRGVVFDVRQTLASDSVLFVCLALFNLLFVLALPTMINLVPVISELIMS